MVWSGLVLAFLWATWAKRNVEMEMDRLYFGTSREDWARRLRVHFAGGEGGAEMGRGRGGARFVG